MKILKYLIIFVRAYRNIFFEFGDATTVMRAFSSTAVASSPN
jgi:hypothetical protein